VTAIDLPYVEIDLPPLQHVGIVVLDLETAARDLQRRWGTHITDIAEVTLHDARYHHRPATISFKRGLISSGASQIELVEPRSDSPFRDFMTQRKGDGVHHLAYIVDHIDPYLERLKPTCAELVLDGRLPEDGGRVVLVDGFAHGPSIELIERTARSSE
jgi:methylmalonyl-CoA/ethylmalonyl-CoA epimerase